METVVNILFQPFLPNEHPWKYALDIFVMDLSFTCRRITNRCLYYVCVVNPCFLFFLQMIGSWRSNRRGFRSQTTQNLFSSRRFAMGGWEICKIKKRQAVLSFRSAALNLLFRRVRVAVPSWFARGLLWTQTKTSQSEFNCSVERLPGAKKVTKILVRTCWF